MKTRKQFIRDLKLLLKSQSNTMQFNIICLRLANKHYKEKRGLNDK